MELVVVHDNGSLGPETSSNSVSNEEDQVGVGNPGSDIKVLNRQFSNDCNSKGAPE